MTTAMNLAAVDLNLLVAFEALLAERNVTRAGRRVGLGQPAMSAALGRLRALFADELLVRTPGGPMRPTAKALALGGPLADILGRLRGMLDADAGFDPSSARAVVRFATSDYPAGLVLPTLLARLGAEAPLVDIRVQSLDKRNAFDRLDRGEADFLIGSFRNVPKRIRRQRLYTDSYVCVARRGHPAVRPDGEADLEAYLAAPHVLVTLAADDRGIVDEALARIGRRRRVGATVPEVHLVPPIVAATDMIGVVPRRAAADLAVLTPPVALPSWNVDLFWGGVADAEPVARWIRAALAAIGRAIEAAPGKT
jgi:DNA-binding transcriptional LysR family regulator